MNHDSDIDYYKIVIIVTYSSFFTQMFNQLCVCVCVCVCLFYTGSPVQSEAASQGRKQHPLHHMSLHQASQRSKPAPHTNTQLIYYTCIHLTHTKYSKWAVSPSWVPEATPAEGTYSLWSTSLGHIATWGGRERWREREMERERKREGARQIFISMIVCIVVEHQSNSDRKNKK